MPNLHTLRVLDYRPLQCDIVDGSQRRDYKKIFESVIAAVNKATSLYHNKWKENQENALKINLMLLKFNVRISSHNRLICSDPKIVMGLLGTGFKEHMFSGMKHLSQKEFTYSEYLNDLDNDLKFMETERNSGANLGRTSCYHFIRFLVDPIITLFNISDYGHRKCSAQVSDANIRLFFQSWVNFSHMSHHRRSDNPFISNYGGWMSKSEHHSRNKWQHFITQITKWESSLSEKISTGWVEGTEIEMYNGTGKRKLKAIPQQVAPEEMLLPTYDRNLNNILLKFKELLVEAAPKTEQTIDADPLLYNFFTALESHVNKENLRAKLDTSTNGSFKQNVDSDYYLYQYAIYFLSIFQQSIDQYHHYTDNQKDESSYNKSANVLDPFTTEARIQFWGEATLANSLHYRDGWHGKAGRIRVIYYSLFITQVEIIIKTTRILRDKLDASFKKMLYQQAIYQIIDCLKYSFQHLKNTSFFGGSKSHFSFYKILENNTKTFAHNLRETIVNDNCEASIKDKELTYLQDILEYWNLKLSSIAAIKPIFRPKVTDIYGSFLFSVD